MLRGRKGGRRRKERPVQKRGTKAARSENMTPPPPPRRRRRRLPLPLLPRRPPLRPILQIRILPTRIDRKRSAKSRHGKEATQMIGRWN